MQKLTHSNFPGFNLYIGALPEGHIFGPYVETDYEALLSWCEEDSACDILFHTEFEDELTVRWVRHDRQSDYQHFIEEAIEFLDTVSQPHRIALSAWWQGISPKELIEAEK